MDAAIIAALPPCVARHVEGEAVFCLHPRVRGHGGQVDPRQCACPRLNHVCAHINEPATLKTLEQVREEAEQEAARPKAVQVAAGPCAHRGLEILRQEKCQLCGARERQEPVYPCAIHGECTQHRYKSGRQGPACCLGCPEYSPKGLAEVTFGITAFERPRHLERLVASIGQYYPGARIVVADNGTQKANLPDSVKVRDLPFDCGLSAARHALVEQLDTPYFLLLEDDFVFTAETKIEPFLAILEHDSALGAIGGRMRNADGRLVDAALDFTTGDGAMVGRPTTQPMQRTMSGQRYRYCDKHINFGLWRKEMLADHSWDGLPKVGEHVAYFWRVKAAGKWRVGFTPEVTINHDTTGRSPHYRKHRGRAAELHDAWIAANGFPGGYRQGNQPADQSAPAIPRMFHRVWLGGNPMPAEFVEFGQTWLRHNPGWTLREWREPEIESLGELVTGELWKRAKNFAQASDVLRYELLYRFGGVYLDTDFEALKPLGALLKGASFVGAGERPGMVSAGFIAAAPSHPLIKDVLDILPERLASDLPQAKATGPGMLTAVWQRHKDKPGIKAYGPRLFYPYSFSEKHRRHEHFPNAIAAHHWQGSWVTGEKWSTAKPAFCVMIMTARTGSTWLCSLMASTRKLGKLAEYLASGRRQLSNPNAQGSELLAAIIERSKTPNGVSGLKCHIDEWMPFYETVKDDPRMAGAKYVHLTRGDLLRQAISHRRALDTDVWAYKGNVPLVVPSEIDPSKVLERLQENIRRNTTAIDWFRAHAIKPHRILYEGLQDDPTGTVKRLAAFLGVPAGALPEPSSKLQIQREATTERQLAEFMAWWQSSHVQQ